MRAHAMTMVLFLAPAACGDVTSGKGQDDDGGDAGAGADAAQPGPVQVTVRRQGDQAALEGVPVYFFGPDGALEATVDTDGDGVATAELLAGGAVFTRVPTPVVMGAPASRDVWGIVDVRPGDELLLSGALERWDPSATMDVVLPLGKLDPYQVSTPCGDNAISSNTVPITFYENCAPETFPLVAIGSAGEDRYAIVGAPDNELSPGGMIEVEGAWALVGDEEIALTDIPGQVADIVGTLSEARLGGQSLFVPGLSGSAVEVTTNVATISPRRVEGLDELALHLNVRANPEALVGKQEVTVWNDGGEDTPSVSLEEVLLPWVGLPFYEAGARRFGIPLAGSGGWDATAVNIYWFRDDEKMFSSGRWAIIAPPGVDEIVLPELPEELAELLPADLESVQVSVYLIESEALDGWDDARPLGLDTYWESWYVDPRAGTRTTIAFSAQPFL